MRGGLFVCAPSADGSQSLRRAEPGLRAPPARAPLEPPPCGKTRRSGTAAPRHGRRSRGGAGPRPIRLPPPARAGKRSRRGASAGDAPDSAYFTSHEAAEPEVVVAVADVGDITRLPCQNGARQRAHSSCARIVSQMNQMPFISVTPSVVEPRLAIWSGDSGRFMCSAALPSRS